MKTKEQINERISSLIRERGEHGREIDRLKAKEELVLDEKQRLIFAKNSWSHISSLINSLEWVVDDVRYPYVPNE